MTSTRKYQEQNEVVSPRLGFIDGLRGLSALYVVLYHAAGEVPPPMLPLRLLAWPLQFGHYAVGVFIVLSGYCLMLPIASSDSGVIEGGWCGYALRRARRILPAYYVVLLLAVLAVAIVHRHYSPMTAEEAAVLRLSPGTLLSHLFMIHNLREPWSQAFDPPMWSVAAECQIYVLFPLLLVPLWRRLGAVAMVLVAIAGGMAPHLLLPPATNLDWTCPWYAGLFALGMAAAAINFPRARETVIDRHAVLWGRTGIILSMALVVLLALRPQPDMAHQWMPDILLGSAVSAVLVRSAAQRRMVSLGQTTNSGWALLLGVLERPIARHLGLSSYSLYLLHAPILWMFTICLSRCGLDENVTFLLRMLGGVPLSVALSYGFYLIVERRFQRTRTVAGNVHQSVGSCDNLGV